jgi:hypothetical protein
MKRKKSQFKSQLTNPAAKAIASVMVGAMANVGAAHMPGGRSRVFRSGKDKARDRHRQPKSWQYDV